jgi:pimeloyl-ACP methyl ester carboxylesterase
MTLAMPSETTGSGSPLVLVPGGLTGWLSWKPLADDLSPERQVTRTQLLAVDLGLKNQPLPADYSLQTESAALAKTIEDLGLAVADYAAWSYGAEITLDFALNHPDRIRSLTLIEPPAIWVLRSRGPLAPEMEQERRTMRQLGPGPISEEQLAWFCHFAGFVPSGVDPRTLPQWPAWAAHRQSLRTQDVAFRHDDSIDRVRRFTKPTLLLKGIGSSNFLRQIIDILGREFPRAEVVEMTGGHAPHLANHDRFLEIFRKFLASA